MGLDPKHDVERIGRVPRIVRADRQDLLVHTSAVKLQRIKRRIAENHRNRRVLDETLEASERRSFWVLLTLDDDCASGGIAVAVDRDEQSIAIDSLLGS